MGKIPLGEWIKLQRKTVLPDSERGKLLTEIKFRFENKKKVLLKPWQLDDCMVWLSCWKGKDK